jgi:DNA-binding MarR family transcriptional regulator
MSIGAIAYVKGLQACRDGARLSQEQKLVLMCLADAYDPHRGIASASLAQLADEALCDVATVKAVVAYLSSHEVLAQYNRVGRLVECAFVELREEQLPG